MPKKHKEAYCLASLLGAWRLEKTKRDERRKTKRRKEKEESMSVPFKNNLIRFSS